MKSLLIILFLIVLGSNSSAQKFDIGGKVGVGRAMGYLKFDNADAQASANSHISSLPSVGLNLIVDYHWTDKFALSAEPGFIRKGYRNTSSIDFKRTVSQTFLHMPILLQYYLFNGLHVDFGYELGHPITIEYKENEEPGVNLKELGLYEKVFEHSVNIGLGFEVHSNIEIGLRYGYGLSKLDEIFYSDINGIVTTRGGEMNNYIQLYFGYKTNRKTNAEE